MTTPDPIDGQYGPEALLLTNGDAAVGATVTAPAGYTATVDAFGNLTVTGPASDAVPVTVQPVGGSAFATSLPVHPRPSALEAERERTKETFRSLVAA